MARLFKDCSLEAARQGSATALLALWASTLLDVVETAFEERIQEVWNMNTENVYRPAALVLLAGAAILLLVIATSRFELSYDDPLGGPDGWIEYTRLIGMPISYLLLAAGAWLLNKANLPGLLSARIVLGIGVLGALVAAVASLPEIQTVTPWWLYPAGYVVFLTALGIFALGLRRQRPRTAVVLSLASFLLPVVALITLGFHRFWWSRGGATTGFTVQAGLDLVNTSQLVAPIILCIAAILLLRTSAPAQVSQ